MSPWTHGCPVYINSGSRGPIRPPATGAGPRVARSGSGSAGPRTQKVPENESEHGQDDYQDRPKHLRARVRAALKDIDDRPDVGDQDNQTEYALILHEASFLLLPVATPHPCAPSRLKIVRSEAPR